MQMQSDARLCLLSLAPALLYRLHSAKSGEVMTYVTVTLQQKGLCCCVKDCKGFFTCNVLMHKGKNPFHCSVSSLLLCILLKCCTRVLTHFTIVFNVNIEGFYCKSLVQLMNGFLTLTGYCLGLDSHLWWFWANVHCLLEKIHFWPKSLLYRVKMPY